MKRKVIAFTEGGVVVGEGEEAAKAFLSAARPCEACVVVLAVSEHTAPAIEETRHLVDLTGICTMVAWGRTHELVKHAFASVLGALAGMARLERGPTTALLSHPGMHEAFETHRGQVEGPLQRGDWPEVLAALDIAMRGSDIAAWSAWREPESYRMAGFRSIVESMKKDGGAAPGLEQAVVRS